MWDVRVEGKFFFHFLSREARIWRGLQVMELGLNPTFQPQRIFLYPKLPLIVCKNCKGNDKIALTLEVCYVLQGKIHT